MRFDLNFPMRCFLHTITSDAHLELRDAWNDTHNLVIVSPFGSTVAGYQKDLAPFRDSDQTATFLATLVATGEVSKEKLPSLLGEPYRFEVGRNGVQQLAVHPGHDNEVLPMSPALNWFSQWWAQRNIQMSFALVGVFLALLAIWIDGLMTSR